MGKYFERIYKKVFIINSEMLKNGPKFAKDYFEELELVKEDFIKKLLIYIKSVVLIMIKTVKQLKSYIKTYIHSDKINDGKEYRKKLYTYDEIIKVIEKYGLPQNWNSEGEYGPERYVEVHVWSDDPINEYLKNEADNKCCTI